MSISGLDGYFKIEVEDNQVLLTVFPPMGDGKPVVIEEIINFLKAQHFNQIDNERIGRLIGDASGNPMVIIDDISSQVRDAKVEVSVSNNKMEALVTIVPAKWGEALTIHKIEDAIKSAGICHGVLLDTFDEIIRNQATPATWLIAKGTLPKKGQDEQLRLLFDAAQYDHKPQFKGDGSVDYFNIKNILYVRKGRALIEKIPCTEGKPGMDVYGGEIPSPPTKRVQFPRGKNTVVDDAGAFLYATCDGKLHMEREGELYVNPVLEITGDVNYTVGNIRFPGDVIVSGNVLPGFLVVSEGDIQISGYVEAAVVKAGGNVIIEGGVQGRGKGQLEAGKSIYCKFIENTTVKAGQTIEVGRDIVMSVVTAQHVVEVKSRRGRIVGGQIRVGEAIIANSIGSPMGTLTTLEVGINPIIHEQFNLLQERKQDLSNQRRQVSMLLTALVNIQQQGAKLPLEKQELMAKLIKTESHLKEAMTNCDKQIEAVEEAIHAIKSAYILANNEMHPGTKLIIGKYQRFIDRRYERVKFSLSETREISYESI